MTTKLEIKRGDSCTTQNRMALQKVKLSGWRPQTSLRAGETYRSLSMLILFVKEKLMVWSLIHFISLIQLTVFCVSARLKSIFMITVGNKAAEHCTFSARCANIIFYRCTNRH